MEFLKTMSGNDRMLDHSIEECGQCFHLHCMAEVARNMIAEMADLKTGDETPKNVIDDWSDRVRKMWMDSKYYKLYQQSITDGKEPEKAFAEMGWEM